MSRPVFGRPETGQLRPVAVPIDTRTPLCDDPSSSWPTYAGRKGAAGFRVVTMYGTTVSETPDVPPCHRCVANTGDSCHLAERMTTR